MNTQGKLISELKWNTRQRLQFIEIKAFYTGTVARSDVAKAFGISDAAATKDLKQYNDLTPGNLTYKQSVFGFVPTETFEPLFTDLSPEQVLPIIATNLAATGGPYGSEPIYGIQTHQLPIPNRYPTRPVLAAITQAIRLRKKLAVSYHSLSEHDSQHQRIIEPHALVDTGLRWHVRAYNCETYDFRDFVLSRLTDAKLIDENAESSEQFDDEWVESITVILAPHPKLKKEKQEILLMDYGVSSEASINSEIGTSSETIKFTIRRSLIGYLLSRLSVDSTIDHSMNPNAFQLVLVNRKEIEPFARWALQ